MRYVVGYTADKGGRRALTLACTMARQVAGGDDPVELDLVMVVRNQSPVTSAVEGADPQGYEEILDATLREWANDALASVPDDVKARVLIRAADSEAEGILAAADEVDATVIVIAPRAHAWSGSLGSVANALLHSSNRPVLLAMPASTPDSPSDPGPTRVTAFVGSKQGAEAVAEAAAITAQHHGASLRIVSLLDLDVAAGAPEERVAATTARIEEIAGHAALSAEVVVATGRGLNAAIDSVEWRRHELAMIGSARLGGHRLFLGPTAHRLVRALPVPLCVVPRRYEAQWDEAQREETP